MLNHYMLAPEKTCADLRSAFALDFLPVVETPDQAGLRYEENWVVLPDGNGLLSWYLPAPQSRGTVLIAYGAVGSMPCYLFTARLLVESGWSVMMYDYRGFGRSTGEASIEHMVGDFDEMLSWTLEYTKQPRVTVMGISLGSIPAIAVAARRPGEVNGVVVDSPVSLTAEMRRFKFLAREAAARLGKLLNNEIFSDRVIANLQVPSLFYLHEEDGVTPPGQVRDLYRRAGAEKQLACIPEVGHVRGVYTHTNLYAAYLNSFLARVWESRSPESSRLVVDPAKPAAIP